MEIFCVSIQYRWSYLHMQWITGQREQWKLYFWSTRDTSEQSDASSTLMTFMKAEIMRTFAFFYTVLSICSLHSRWWCEGVGFSVIEFQVVSSIFLHSLNILGEVTKIFYIFLILSVKLPVHIIFYCCYMLKNHKIVRSCDTREKFILSHTNTRLDCNFEKSVLWLMFLQP